MLLSHHAYFTLIVWSFVQHAWCDDEEVPDNQDTDFSFEQIGKVLHTQVGQNGMIQEDVKTILWTLEQQQRTIEQL